MAELVGPPELAPFPDVVVEALDDSAPAGGARVFAAGVYRAEVVNAFDPAPDVDPISANASFVPLMDIDHLTTVLLRPCVQSSVI